tara:strand:+ start:249 stop:632 length:384 start_codon:yes stop_codon:yes gene_type:complete
MVMGKKIIKKGFSRLRSTRIVRPFETKENIILRDFLALERTTLANERTLFAYIRTSLYLILGGIALLQLEKFNHLIWLGYISFGISVVLIIYGVVRYVVLKRKLQKFYNTIDLQHVSTTGKKSGEEA